MRRRGSSPCRRAACRRFLSLVHGGRLRAFADAAELDPRRRRRQQQLLQLQLLRPEGDAAQGDERRAAGRMHNTSERARERRADPEARAPAAARRRARYAADKSKKKGSAGI